MIVTRTENGFIEDNGSEYVIKLNKINIIKKNVIKVKFTDYFEIVKPSHKLSSLMSMTSDGKYPVYSACNKDQPQKYINDYIYDSGEEEYLRINNNGSVGYSFVTKGKFSSTSNTSIYKPKTNDLDLFVTSLLLTTQLNKQFNYFNILNKTRLSKLELYVYLKTDQPFISKTEFITAGKIPKLEIDKSKVRRVKFTDYFEIVKPSFQMKSLKNLNKGEFPHFGSKNQNVADCYVDCYNYEDDNLLRINRIGSVGYCYPQHGKCAVNNNCLCYKMKQDCIDLNITCMLITNELKEKYNYSRPLTISILNKLDVYVYFN